MRRYFLTERLLHCRYFLTFLTLTAQNLNSRIFP